MCIMVQIPLSVWLFLLALAPVFPAPASAQDPPQPPQETVAAPQVLVFRDLRSVLDTGLVLLDRNGDGVVDFLDTRILFSSHPTEAEVAAASNLAARLGYETSAMDLGIAGQVDGQ
ncbi:MAG: hypothetical protein PVJ04_17415, partial [Gemmatimonadota bacterium]